MATEEQVKVVKEVPRAQPDVSIYVLALIALARQLQDQAEDQADEQPRATNRGTSAGDVA